jgi:hypothetical protein
MPNIKLYYMYRDGANYKNHGEVIFRNPDVLSIETIENILRSKLIDEAYFYVDKWNLPDLHFGKWDNEIDHTFHEYESVEYTNEATTDDRTIKQLLINLHYPVTNPLHKPSL